MEYEAVIGLEVHIQLSTDSKIFCGSSTAFGAEPNTLTDPLSLGLPGSLPVLNEEVVNSAIKLGLATNCQIRSLNRFARKHYFYPDLPKGYQISQFEEPICERGNLTINLGESQRVVGIKRIHMEEDAGKTTHDNRIGASLVDLNRAGVPLLELVSEPDLRSPADAGAFLRTIRQLVCWLGISDGNMEEGSLRCDANVSLRPVGELKFGTRTEIKNINSFKFVERALEYEIARQLSLLKSGENIVQETRLFDSEANLTRPMRGKEESEDYRYFPDPDLPPLMIEEHLIRKIQASMPVLPNERTKELVETYGLSEYDANVLTSELALIEYFESVFKVCDNAKASCNWITSELFGALNKQGLNVNQSPISPEDLGNLIKLIDDQTISGKMAKTVFDEMFESGESPEKIVEKRGLKQITDPEFIKKAVLEVLEANPNQLQEYLEGNQRLHGYFVGQVMKATAGSASPAVVNEVLQQELKKRLS